MVAVLSYGGGVNSTALLILAVRLKIPPDLVAADARQGKLPFGPPPETNCGCYDGTDES